MSDENGSQAASAPRLDPGSWTPPQLPDGTVANAARVYNVWSGGRDNYAVDREAAQLITQAAGCVPGVVAAGRRFTLETVRLLAGRDGLTQFIDIGCGLPEGDTVHAVAQAAAAGARVLYVDNDPVVLSHARARMTDKQTAVLDADATAPQTILGSAVAQAHLDWQQPIAVLMTAVLHHLDDTTAQTLLDALRAVLVLGSAVVITHPTAEGIPVDVVTNAVDAYATLIGPVHLRTQNQLEQLLAGFSMPKPEPGPISTWTNDSGDARLPLLAAIARITQDTSASPGAVRHSTGSHAATPRRRQPPTAAPDNGAAGRTGTSFSLYGR